MDIFVLATVVFFLFYGVSVFIPERTIIVISGVAALVAGIIGFTRL